MATSNPREQPTNAWQIVRSAIADGSPTVKNLARRLSFVCILVIGLQIWDSRNARGASGVAEFSSALLGICGIGLLGVAGTLRLTMKEAAERGGADDDAGVAGVLLALPTLGFAAGLALGLAALLMIVRGVLGAAPMFAAAGTLLYGALTVVAARTVTQSAGTLFQVATLHATRAAAHRDAAAAARVDALQARMNPHVLFNALNTVAALVRSDPPAAERVVHTLADVLQQSLHRSAEADGTVAQEVEYVKNCLALEAERWGPHLRVVWSMDEEVLPLRMPPFTIQPLVENALRHGLGSRLDGGRIEIAIRRVDDRLEVAVRDDGAGFPQHWREGHGIGNLRQRLTALYGDTASLTIESHAARGACLTVRFPAHIAGRSAATLGASGASADR